MDDPVRALGRKVTPDTSRGAQPLFRHWGVVTAVVAGPPKTITVKISGSTTATPGIRYVFDYTPLVNDVVMLDCVGGDFVGVGTLA